MRFRKELPWGKAEKSRPANKKATRYNGVIALETDSGSKKPKHWSMYNRLGHKLSPYQLQVLQALADGMFLKEFAFKAGRTGASVNDATVLFRQKLGARNNSHAVAIALRKGLIH
ncbi:hypothetical protein ES708_26232 [subsurface metagenome]